MLSPGRKYKRNYKNSDGHDHASTKQAAAKNKTIFHQDDAAQSENRRAHNDKLMSDKSAKDHHASSSSSSEFPSFSKLSTSSSQTESCRRYQLYVDFEKMGWSGWIIHPTGYNAFHCKGKCFFPMSQRLNPSSHATVQSIMHVLGLGNQPVDLPCCAPDKLYDITLLYFAENDDAVVQRYKDMVAGSCACR